MKSARSGPTPARRRTAQINGHNPQPTTQAPGATPERETRLRPRGSNQGGMREFNERVVLQAIRLHGSTPKAQIARLTHLTPQTVQIIISRLEADHLVRRLTPVRGKVGQPSVPMALDPDGAYSIGIKIGRRSMDMLLVDFSARARERVALNYSFPDPDVLFAEIKRRLRELKATLPSKLRSRLYGVGVAAPLALEGWQTLLGVAPEQAAKWARIDIRERVQAMTDLPVELVKDTAAACVAELVAGRGRSIRSFLYIFVDTFIGGGLVIDSHLRAGFSGNAGAVGSMPLGQAEATGTAAPPQLLSVASLYRLESLFHDQGLDAGAATDERALAPPWRAHTQQWLHESARAMALAVNNAACLLDLEGVIVDGSFSRALLDALLLELDAALARYSWEGVARPDLLAGTIGSDARAIGGALLPMYANFAPDRDLFLKLAS